MSEFESSSPTRCGQGQYYDGFMQTCSDCKTICEIDQHYCCTNCPDFCSGGDEEGTGLSTPGVLSGGQRNNVEPSDILMKHQSSPTTTTTTSMLNNEPMLSNANNNTTTFIIVCCAFIVLLAIVLVLVIYILIRSRRRRTVTKSPGESSGNLRTTLIQSNDTSQLRNNKDGDVPHVNARNCCSKHDSLKSNGLDNNQDELLLNRPIYRRPIDHDELTLDRQCAVDMTGTVPDTSYTSTTVADAVAAAVAGALHSDVRSLDVQNQARPDLVRAAFQ